MRTKGPILLVIALGMAAMMWGMAGVDEAYSSDSIDDLQSADELQSEANQSAVNDSFEGQAGQTDDGDIVGLIVSGLSSVARFAGMVALLPVELRNLGAPWWFAFPIGVTAQAIVGIGIIQFGTGRLFE